MRVKSPVRLTIAIITVTIIIWMCCNFVIALISGQKFSILGNTLGDGIETFVVAGVDEEGYRTDLILLCQTNRKENTVRILQIPRDTWVDNKRNDKKINSAYYSGFDVLAEEIYQITGVRPEHSVMVSFAAFRDIIDAAGGVTVNVPMDMHYEDPYQDLLIDLKKGKQKLDGEHAEMYMRYRSGYTTGDIGRLSAQQELYQGIADKLLTPWGLLRMPAVSFAVKRHTTTDMSGGKMSSLLRDMVVIGKDNVEILTLPGEGKYIGGGSYFAHYPGQTKKMMQEHFVLSH